MMRQNFSKAASFYMPQHLAERRTMSGVGAVISPNMYRAGNSFHDQQNDGVGHDVFSRPHDFHTSRRELTRNPNPAPQVRQRVFSIRSLHDSEMDRFASHPSGMSFTVNAQTKPHRNPLGAIDSCSYQHKAFSSLLQNAKQGETLKISESCGGVARSSCVQQRALRFLDKTAHQVSIGMCR